MLTLAGVIFLNYWIWKIIRDNLLIAIVLIILTFLLFQSFIGKNLKTRVFIIMFLLFASISFIMLRPNFDKSIQEFTPEDEVKLNDRHFYYSFELGNLFLNNKVLNYYKNYSLPVYKIKRNLFSNLDLNLYFFSSAPRERAGVNEFKKYPFVLIPFFISGALLIIYRGSLQLVSYLAAAALVSAFVASGYALGPILFFPLINVCIAVGIISVPGMIKRLKKCI